MTSKLRLKIGRLELDFEGSEEFLKEHLTKFIGEVKELGLAAKTEGESGETDEEQQSTKPKVNGALTTSIISAKFGVNSGPDLIIAAMTKLCIVGQQEKVTRKEITKEMKTASTFFKKTYVNNLTSYLDTLIAGQRILDHGNDTYALSAGEITALEPKLAQAK